MPRQPIGKPHSVSSWRTAWATVVLVGACLLAVQCWTLRDRPFIGSPDEAAYAHQARMILAGHGLRVNYVQHFFRRYPRLPHPEDHYGPGYGVLLAPLFRLPLKQEFAAVLPALVAGSLLLPPLTLLTAKRLGASPAVAAGATAFVLLAPLPRQLSDRALADVPFTCLILVSWLLGSSEGPRRPYRWFAAGAVLGLAYLVKPAALLYLPALWLAVSVMMPRDEGRRVAGLAALLLCVGFALSAAPWMARNAALFGDPLYSGNKYIAAGQDYRPDWSDCGFRRVWWVHEGESPPVITEVLQRYGVERVAVVIGGRLRKAFSDESVRMPTLALLVGGLLLRRREGTSLAVLYLGHTVLLAVAFPVLSRYQLLLWPASAALAGAALASLWQSAPVHRRLSPRPGSPVLRLLTALALGVLASWPGPRDLVGNALVYGPTGSNGRVSVADAAMRDAAEWCGAALPQGSVAMTDDCWRFTYYSDVPSVNVPTDSASAIDAVVRAYGVTHLVLVPAATPAAHQRWAENYLRESRVTWTPAPSRTGVVIYALSTAEPKTATYGSSR